MNYREQLNKIKELNLNMHELIVAYELDCVLEVEYTENEFEELCAYATWIYLKSENLTAYAIVRAINDMIVYDGFTIAQVISKLKWDFITIASQYMN
jgi:hypothetical protein